MPESNGTTVLYRLGQVERKVETIESVAETAAQRTAIHEEQINGDGGVRRDVSRLADEVKRLRYAAWGVASAVVGSAIALQFLGSTH